MLDMFLSHMLDIIIILIDASGTSFEGLRLLLSSVDVNLIQDLLLFVLVLGLSVVVAVLSFPFHFTRFSY